MEEQKTCIEIPVGVHQGLDCFIVYNTPETDELLGRTAIVVQKESLEEAKAAYLRILKYHLEFIEERSKSLDRWKPFQKGGSKKVGSFWFTIFGLRFHIRYGKEMKYGWYIPFTRVNILFHNHWKKPKPSSN